MLGKQRWKLGLFHPLALAALSVILLLSLMFVACGGDEPDDESDSERESGTASDRNDGSSDEEDNADSRVIWGSRDTPTPEATRRSLIGISRDREEVAAPAPTRRGLAATITSSASAPVIRTTPIARSSTPTPMAPAPTAVPEGWVLTESEAVHRSAYSGDVEEVERLLEQGADTTARASITNYKLGFEGHNLTPLHLAVAFNSSVEVAETLMEWGSDVEAQDNSRRTPLHWAAWNAEPASVEQLLEWGANVYAQAYNPYGSSRGWTPLHYTAAFNTDTAVADLLLEWGADIAATDGYSATPLHWAVQYNTNTEIVNLLLERGANLEALDGVKQTPLHYAVRNIYPEMATLLLDRGANIEALRSDGQTPLHGAALNLAEPEAAAGIVKLLLDRGANIEAQDNSGQTPLLLVVQAHHYVSSPTGEQITPESATQMIEVLLDQGANIDARQDGWTPLLWAAYNNQPEIAQVLLDEGADRKAENNEGQTACQVARARGSFAGTQLLGTLCRP